MILSHILLLASAVHTHGGWFSSDREYARWSNTELRTWLEDRNIKVPSSFDNHHLIDLVDANWHNQLSPLSAYVKSGQQWSFDQYKQAQEAFEKVKDQSFDKWDDSRLKSFLLEQGIVAPSGHHEQLVLLAKNRHRAYTDAAALYSSLASTSISSAYASASDGAYSTCQRIGNAVAQATQEVVRAIDETHDYVYSTWDDNRLRTWLENRGIVEARRAETKEDLRNLANNYHNKVNSAAWEIWSDSYIREWLTAHNLLKPSDELSRSSLLGEMRKYYYDCTENVWNTWSNSELKAWLVDHEFLRNDSKKNRDEMVAMVEKHYLSALDSIWGAWTDSDIRQWLSEHGYIESDDHLKSRKDLLEMMYINHSDAEVPYYLVWPDVRLRAFLRERGISESALPSNRIGLLHEVRLHWVETSTKAENVFARLKGVIDSSVEAMEDKVSRALEVLSGRPHDAVCHVSEEAQRFAQTEAKEKAQGEL